MMSPGLKQTQKLLIAVFLLTLSNAVADSRVPAIRALDREAGA